MEHNVFSFTALNKSFLNGSPIFRTGIGTPHSKAFKSKVKELGDVMMVRNLVKITDTLIYKILEVLSDFAAPKNPKITIVIYLAFLLGYCYALFQFGIVNL